MNGAQYPDLDLKGLAPQVAIQALGQPTITSKKQLRWGRKGSLVLFLDTGFFFDHETQTQMGLLDFVVHHWGCNGHASAARMLHDMHGLPPAVSGGGLSRGSSTLSQPPPEEPDDKPFDIRELKLNLQHVPDDPSHPLNIWAEAQCAKSWEVEWPDGVRLLTQDSGLSLLGVWAPLDSWLNPKGLMPSTITGAQQLYITPDGQPRDVTHRDGTTRNKNTLYGSRMVESCLLLGQIELDGRLALCEGIKSGLAIHWGQQMPVAVIGNTLSRAIDMAEPLRHLMHFPHQLKSIDLWPDNDRPNPKTGELAGQKGALALYEHLTGQMGLTKSQVRIVKYGSAGEDPADWFVAEADRLAEGRIEI